MDFHTSVNSELVVCVLEVHLHACDAVSKVKG